ncbi:type VI secretion system baseplate subunit TssE [Rhodopila sp.]|jgi:type VI secretion system protein ImpF|uniref:type VI secretion system baseplate subunit TssE n=1 Tax=Rhodopila sp. TaxID=2480087 RepID=UPI002C9080B7|nr:type VI secretion system baseplate subunit TssE [Rhodopila sp.]HVZ09632.1 type VI secretion system baseplate subunit TssE [Rhodopila sp.]
MSGTRDRFAGTRDQPVQRVPARAQLPLLDRLIDDAPERTGDQALSAAEAMAILRRSVRRDIEALLNGRRRWRSWPAALTALALSPLNFGIPDCTAGRFHGTSGRDALCREVEDTLRLFEKRFRSVSVSLAPTGEGETTLRLRINAVLHAEPAPEPVSFDMELDPVTADAVVRQRDDL